MAVTTGAPNALLVGGSDGGKPVKGRQYPVSEGQVGGTVKGLGEKVGVGRLSSNELAQNPCRSVGPDPA